MATVNELQKIASQVRRDIVRMVTASKSGHPGGSLGSTDIMTVLFFNEMKQDPKTWTRDAKGQDAFILSAGHMAPVYYSVLARAGYFPKEELGTLRKFGSRLQGHPSVERGLPGIFLPSGSLGQGLAAAAGIALGKKLDKEDNNVYVLCGDGESEEGEIWESGMFAVHHKLDNLIAMTDVNGQQIDGPTSSVAAIAPLDQKWKAFGWNVISRNSSVAPSGSWVAPSGRRGPLYCATKSTRRWLGCGSGLKMLVSRGFGIATTLCSAISGLTKASFLNH